MHKALCWKTFPCRRLGISILICYVVFTSTNLYDWDHRHVDMTRFTLGNTTAMIDTDWLKQRQKLLSLNGPKKVFLFAYMKGGSTIAGKLFNTDPQANMWYEPGDVFFAEYHGIHFKSLPQNDLYLTDFTRREFGTEEINALNDFFSNMLTCQYNKIPMLAMHHPFWKRSQTTRSYLECTLQNEEVKLCPQFVDEICGTKRVEVSLAHGCHEVIKQTRQLIQKNQNRSLSDQLQVISDVIFKQHNVSRVLLGPTVMGIIEQEACKRDLSNNNADCMRAFVDRCRSAKVHVLQVNRIKMEDLETLIQRHPDIHVIHYTRDPRAIALSRSKTRMLWDTNTTRLSRECQFLCQRMTEDLRQRRILEAKYPGLFLPVTYEELAQDPNKTANKIYSFLNMMNETSPPGWSESVASNRTSKWVTEIPREELLEIGQYCNEYFQKVNYPIYK